MISFGDAGKIIPDAYHGTSKNYAEGIVVTQKFRISKGSDCYLGDGIYFFEGDKDQAKWWARKKYKNKSIGIIKASINVGMCLDLLISEHREFVKEARRKIEQTAKISVADAVVLNFITTELNPEIDTIKGVFFKYGNDLRKISFGSRIYDHVFMVICVKKHKNILTIALM